MYQYYIFSIIYICQYNYVSVTIDIFSCVGDFTRRNYLVHNTSIHTIVNTVHVCLLPKLLQDLNKSFSQTLPDSTRLHCKIIQESVTLKPKKNIVFKHLLGANTP